MNGLPTWATARIWFLEPARKLVYGAETEDWSNPVKRMVEGVDWWHATTKELVERGRDTDVEGIFVNMPVLENMPSGTNRVRFEQDGRDYEIIGAIQVNKSATGRLDYADFYAERITNRG